MPYTHTVWLCTATQYYAGRRITQRGAEIRHAWRCVESGNARRCVETQIACNVGKMHGDRCIAWRCIQYDYEVEQRSRFSNGRCQARKMQMANGSYHPRQPSADGAFYKSAVSCRFRVHTTRCTRFPVKKVPTGHAFVPFSFVSTEAWMAGLAERDRFTLLQAAR